MSQDRQPNLTLDEADASNYINYSRAALRVWRRQSRGPAFIQVGRSIRYRRGDLDDWLSAHRVETRDSRGGR
ncbi:MAG: helix-turn-helix transcriptional regulator [Vicinamibacterales bacterium]